MINSARIEELIDKKIRESLPVLIRQEVERELARRYVAELAAKKEQPRDWRTRVRKKG